MTTVASAANDFEIADGAYGRATAYVRAVVDKAKALRWFPADATTDEEIATVRDLVVQHLEMLKPGGADRATRETTIDIVRGGWDVLAQAYRAANPITLEDDPAYARGDWRKLLGAVASELQRRVEVTRSALIVPPLFPFAGKPTILAGMLTTDPARGASVVDDLSWRETIWYLMCDVDSDFWNAIVAALATEDEESTNVFSVLIKIYSRGFFPLGFVGDRFVVCRRA